jgi:mono/diheme cytochrome c family protein
MTTMDIRTATAAALLALVLLQAPAALAADAKNGEELARRWCTACHLVASNQERAPTVAPPFATIGRKPGFDARTLARSMLAPHPQMPERGLAREQAEDIAAYIATLR